MTKISLTDEVCRQLETLRDDPLLPMRRRRWAQIILLYAQGVQVQKIAAQVGLSRWGVRYWRRRFQKDTSSLLGNPIPDTDEAPISDTEALPIAAVPSESVASVALPDIFSLDPRFPGVLPEDALAEAGRKVMRAQLAQVLRFEEGTRQGEDIEALHDMRVATRRLRAAFQVFGDAFDEKALKPHLKRLRNTGRMLGAVRDLDVFLERTRQYLLTKDEAQVQGLQPLLASWEDQREAHRRKMIQYLDSSEYRTFKQDFQLFLETSEAGVRPPVGDQFAPRLVREVAPELIYFRLGNVRAYDARLENATLEELHTLRIEVKRFRYTVEFFQEVLGKQAAQVVTVLKGLQDHLGELHDAQVATQILRDFLGEWDALQAPQPVSDRQSPLAVMEYLTARYADRQHLMLTIKEAWGIFNRVGFRTNLAKAVSAL